MKKSINDNHKRRGRPATGTAPLVGVRMTEEFQSEIKAWARKQPDHPALAAAIRRLVELGLTVKTKAKHSSAAGADRAKQLATKGPPCAMRPGPVVGGSGPFGMRLSIKPGQTQFTRRLWKK